MDNSNKNLLYFQEISNEEKTLKLKVFNYFYFMLSDKKINWAIYFIFFPFF